MVIQWLGLELPLQGAQVQYVVRELRSHKLHGVAKKKKIVSGQLRDIKGRQERKAFLRDFPGGPVDKTPRSQCRRPGFNPWSRN